MKYLKLFENFSDDMIRDIKEIFLELSDFGYEIIVRRVTYMREDKKDTEAIAVDISKNYTVFKYEDIEDTILVLKSYVSEYKIDVEIVSINEFISLDKFSSENDDEFESLGFIIYKS